MINDLFINTLILISATFVGGHLLKEIPERFVDTLYGKVIIGIFGGLLSILLMIYTIEVNGTGTLIDLRTIAILMVSAVGGTLPTIITAIIISVYRIGHFGINIASIFGVIHLVLYVVIFYIIDRKVKQLWKRWTFKLISIILILVLSFVYLLRNAERYYFIILEFSMIIAGVGMLEFYLVQYAKNSNELFRRYRKEAKKDFLTDLYNTREFDKQLNMSIQRSKDHNERLSCLIIDIDHFKKVNDTYGDQAGDVVLRELAAILKETCRSFDVIGRIGGEEFYVLLMDCPPSHSFEVASRVRTAVKEHKFFIEENKYIKLTVSMGISSYPDNAANIEAIVEVADAALYKAKQTGRDRICSPNECII